MTTDKKTKTDVVTFPGLGESGMICTDAIGIGGKMYKVDPPYEGKFGVDFKFELDHKNLTAKVIPPEG